MSLIIINKTMTDSNFLSSKDNICTGAPSSSGNILLPRTPPNCARCKNHGLKITLKGHKRYCKYRSCTCEKCRLTSDRQKIMALQTSWRRAQAQDEARALLVGEVPPSVPNSSYLLPHDKPHQPKTFTPKNEAEEQCNNHLEAVPLFQPLLEGSSDSSSLPSSSSNTASSLVVKKQTLITTNGLPFGQSAEIFLEYCQKLLEKFRYPWEMMPLMYVILKDAKADIEEASRRIDEGQLVVNNYSRQHNLNIYDGGELRGTTRQCG